jgi:hypothetical protein
VLRRANVTASQTAFDTSQTSSVVNIDRDRVEELPIPNRNYLTFVALSPQAAPANPALTQQTLAQGNGGFSFGGLRPGSNAVSIDGVNDDDEYSGSSRTELSPEAISDFQIVNHGFSAESGGAAGVSIDVQTRSGLNRPHGDAFVFVQNGALNGTPPLGLSPYKPDESRLRAGVALGGAIQRDKTFYYLAAEQEIAHGEDTNRRCGQAFSTNSTFSTLRVNPAFDAVNQFASSANSVYNGATITLNRQFSDDFQLLVGYTFSKTIDDASYDSEQPQNSYAPRDERAISLQDQRHRVTLSGLWLIGPDLGDPQDAVANANPGPIMRLLTGLEFAPILSVTSGFRANPITGVDSNREHIYPFATRPIDYGRNSLSTAPNINFDLRVLKMIPLGSGHLDVVTESFNLLNHRNVSLLNTSFGSGTQATPGFSSPIASSTARRVQFSLDYEF